MLTHISGPSLVVLGYSFHLWFTFSLKILFFSLKMRFLDNVHNCLFVVCPNKQVLEKHQV